MNRVSVFVGVALCLFAATVHAEPLFVTPELVESSDVVETALKENAGHASTSFSGAGQALSIGYTANEPITVFLVPLHGDDTYSPSDFIRFVLPASQDGDVTVDLTASPGWSSGERKYLVNMLSKTGDASASFTKLDFVPSGIFTGLSAGFRHLFTAESYLPSSYHALKGYHVFGHEVSLWLGLLTVLAAGIVSVLRPKGKKVASLIAVLIAGSFLYSLRFGLDELSFTKAHLTEYAHGTYDEAGSIHLVAATVRTLAHEHPDTNVFVCRDGTNFKEKLLRYFAYPVPVSSEAKDATGATLALVMDKYVWNVETVIDNRGSRQTLKCGPVNREAKKLSTFDDGSVLFSLTPLR